ncbi:54S ribosomal protein L8, mitochondrial [Savitreella phatthalungensis]
MPIKRNLRGFGRTASHRQAMLRNLVTSLVEHEAIVTTWEKAKEAQQLADKLVTHGKRGTPASLQKVRDVLFDHLHTDAVVPLPAELEIRKKHLRANYVPPDPTTLPPPGKHTPPPARARGELQRERVLVHKVFTTLAQRYADRPGGYTRVLRLPARKGDKARQAVLSFCDGPKDVRFDVTAAAIAQSRISGKELTPLTLKNAAKVVRYRGDAGKEVLEAAVKREETRLRIALKTLSIHGKEDPTVTSRAEA